MIAATASGCRGSLGYYSMQTNQRKLITSHRWGFSPEPSPFLCFYFIQYCAAVHIPQSNLVPVLLWVCRRIFLPLYTAEEHMLQLIVLCCLSLHIVLLRWRRQETNSDLYFIQSTVSSEFQGEPSREVFSWMYFGSPLVSHGGVVAWCPVSGSSAVPRTWADRSAGSHTGTLGDQSDSRHSSHSPFEGESK